MQQIMVKTADVLPDENQPRQLFDPEKLGKLKESVRRYGVITPITVEKVGEKYLLVDGERRLRVSKELNLKEIPATVIAPESAVDRLVKQFHIQEQHENWTPTEKAMTVSKLSQELGVTMQQICDLLALPDTTARRYIAFADIVDKKNYHKNDIGIEWAKPINQLKSFVKKTVETDDKVFTQKMAIDLERAVIKRVKDGQMVGSKGHLTRIKDSFTKNPKLIEKFIDTDITVDEMFVGSKAKGAFHLRNARTSANYVASHIRAFLQEPDVELTSEYKASFKDAKKMIEELLNRAGD